ncbi:MAG: hypothetical protein N2423_04085 [Novosphingobium sp.]|nr:hypothetical protein [Novosphingobium sp.]
MTPLDWPCPLPGGGIAQEYALAFDRQRTTRLLIVPALFDEGHRLRRLTVEVMRRLDQAGIDCFLPDLPGCNESLQTLEIQSTDDWRDAMASAARHFDVTHALGMRGGAMFTPAGLPGWHYAPAGGASILRQMLRARILASREVGREESRESLLRQAMQNGIELAGYRLSAEFVAGFEKLAPAAGAHITTIEQDMIGGSGLWLRAEPGESAEQADALAAILAVGMMA